MCIPIRSILRTPDYSRTILGMAIITDSVSRRPIDSALTDYNSQATAGLEINLFVLKPVGTVAK